MVFDLTNPLQVIMASTLGTFTIFQDSQNENADAMQARKTKGGDISSKVGQPKRAALGTITNTQRIQPFRAAKQGTTENFTIFSDENAGPVKSEKTFAAAPQRQAFTILSDNTGFTSVQNAQPTTATNKGLALKPAVTELARVPLVSVERQLEVEESPMVLDTSEIEPAEVSYSQCVERILCAEEYQDDIYAYLRECEVRHRPKPFYMKKQPDITNSMRTILVDWLVEVAEEYKLHRETLCLSVNYIDRFLSHMSVLRGKLQLVGAACMFIAAKYEEIYPPEVGEFVYITDDTYTKKQVLRMEHLVLKVLSFDVATPTANVFCERFLKYADASDKLKSLAMYLVELTLVDGDVFLKYLPSVIAASAICLANATLGNEVWPASLQRCSQYQVEDIAACLQDLHTCFSNAATHPQQAIREKYKQTQFHEVSLLTPPTALPSSTVV